MMSRSRSNASTMQHAASQQELDTEYSEQQALHNVLSYSSVLSESSDPRTPTLPPSVTVQLEGQNPVLPQFFYPAGIQSGFYGQPPDSGQSVSIANAMHAYRPSINQYLPVMPPLSSQTGLPGNMDLGNLRIESHERGHIPPGFQLLSEEVISQMQRELASLRQHINSLETENVVARERERELSTDLLLLVQYSCISSSNSAPLMAQIDHMASMAAIPRGLVDDEEASIKMAGDIASLIKGRAMLPQDNAHKLMQWFKEDNLVMPNAHWSASADAWAPLKVCNVFIDGKDGVQLLPFASFGITGWQMSFQMVASMTKPAFCAVYQHLSKSLSDKISQVRQGGLDGGVARAGIEETMFLLSSLSTAYLLGQWTSFMAMRASDVFSGLSMAELRPAAMSLALSHRRRAKLFHIWSATQATVSRLIPQQKTQQASLHRVLLDYVRERDSNRRQFYQAQIIPAVVRLIDNQEQVFKACLMCDFQCFHGVLSPYELAVLLHAQQTDQASTKSSWNVDPTAQSSLWFQHEIFRKNKM